MCYYSLSPISWESNISKYPTATTPYPYVSPREQTTDKLAQSSLKMAGWKERNMNESGGINVKVINESGGGGIQIPGKRYLLWRETDHNYDGGKMSQTTCMERKE